MRAIIISCIFFIFIQGCMIEKENLFILEDGKFDLSINLPFEWNLVDSENETFCLYGLCRQDSLSDAFFNTYYISCIEEKEGTKSNYDELVESPYMFYKEEKLISSKKLIINDSFYFVKSSLNKGFGGNIEYLLIECRTIIYDNIEVVLSFWVKNNQQLNIKHIIQKVEKSLRSLKAINIRPNGKQHGFSE